MKPLTNIRRSTRIEKKRDAEDWLVVEGDENGRAMVEVSLLHKSGDRWLTSKTPPFRINARYARAIGAALATIGTDGGRRNG